MQPSALFSRCLTIPYIHTEKAASYAFERRGAALTIYFEASNGAADWKNNLDFPAKAADGGFFAHRGFLSVFHALAPRMAAAVADPDIRRVTSVGYSHGAALALLCHELVLRVRPELCESLTGYGFGCPRVVWGLPSRALLARFDGFTVVRNLDDIVTHLPPAALGFTHVGRLLEVGVRGRYNGIDAHREENILRELRAYEAKEIPR